LAGELEEHNIRINAIAPGPVRTRMTDDVLRAGARAGSRQLQYTHKIVAEAPTADKAVELAVFLACDAAGDVSGRLISAVWDDWRSLSQR
jgi:NAD(P)-dependent dehydrogenase (short-subunit alcohol dehydrogenase family)